VALFMLCGAVGVLVGGFLAARGEARHDRYIAWILVAAALLAVVLAIAVLPSSTTPMLMAVIGFCNGLANPSRDLLVRRAAMSRFGQQAFGRIYGLVYSGLDAGLALAPLVFGLFMDAGHFVLVLLGVAVLQGAAVLTALGVGRHA
jgi:MFS family permease